MTKELMDKGADTMTDLQYKSMVKMAATIVRLADSKEQALKELESLIPESAKES